MKTIEERADEYVDAPCEKICSECTTLEASCRFYNDRLSFIAGAESEYEELTRWNSPECPPDDAREVLVKIKCNDYNVASYNQGKGYCIKEGFYTEILGWREIHE